MKKLIALIGLATLLATPALATEKGPGCGLGKMVWGGQKGLIPHISAATTNGTSASQFFGITSGTSGCEADSIIKAEEEQEAFVAQNLDGLSQDLAMGEGQYVHALASLMGCPADVHGDFAQLGQEQYPVLMGADQVDATIFLSSLKQEMAGRPVLATSCTRIG